MSLGYTITVVTPLNLIRQDLRLSEKPLILRSRNAVTNRNCLIKHTITVITVDCRRDLNPPGWSGVVGALVLFSVVRYKDFNKKS